MNKRYLRIRAEKELNKSPLSKTQYINTLRYFDFCCAYCGKSLFENKLEKDHIIALSKGGLTTRFNIIPACRSCNASKNNSDYYTWYSSQKFFDRHRLAKIDTYVVINKGVSS